MDGEVERYDKDKDYWQVDRGYLVKSLISKAKDIPTINILFDSKVIDVIIKR